MKELIETQTCNNTQFLLALLFEIGRFLTKTCLETMDKSLWNLNDVYLKIKIKREKKTRIITSNRRSTKILEDIK